MESDKIQTVEELQKKLSFLEEQLKNGNDPSAQSRIDLLKWVLKIGPDHIHVPSVGSHLVLDVRVKLGHSIANAVKDACQLANTLGLAYVTFRANGQNYGCLPNGEYIIAKEDIRG